MNYIELFAGCGGLSLGLESLGFELFFANELSPMAGETFAYNLLNEDLSAIPEGSVPEKVKWITSNFAQTDIKKRLRENPQTFPTYDENCSDLTPVLEEIEGRLLVGSIVELNKFLEENPKLVRDIQRKDLDLVSGGPPCQSFSLAGLRQLDNQRNTLPMDFADFVSITRPKIALLENVSGILRAFKLETGKHYAWFEVARAFASKGYYPICLHVNAKYAGAAQNRPRFILLALREDVFKKVQKHGKPEAFKKVLKITESFVAKEQNGIAALPFEDLNYYEIEKHHNFFDDPLFSSLKEYWDDADLFTVEDAIDDLNEIGGKESNYPELLNTIFLAPKGSSLTRQLSNQEHRENSVRVRMRFMLYQHLSDLKSPSNRKENNQIERDTINFLKNPDSHALMEDSIDFLLSREYLSSDGRSLQSFTSERSLTDYLRTIATKKQTQRALLRSNPAPAALSIPDDACHYDKNLQRTLTVREMARFQSFPDWFEFRSKVTTGGKMRRFEVPQYTQVGNAVPPLLGRALGKTIQNILTLNH